MDKIINLGIPHVAEQIFYNSTTNDLLQFKEVSKAWKVLAENILDPRLKAEKELFEAWKDKVLVAYRTGQTKIVEVLLRRSDLGHIDFNVRDKQGKIGIGWACANGHKEVVQLFLEYSASKQIDVNLFPT